MDAKQTVQCPTCRKTGARSSFEPFCSKRCKLVDLGKWLSEEHRVSEPLRPEHFQGYEDLAPGQYLDRPEAEQED